MGDKKIYVVAKIFDQQGCLAYRCKSLNEARCVPGTLEALRADGVQIVLLSVMLNYPAGNKDGSHDNHHPPVFHSANQQL